MGGGGGPRVEPAADQPPWRLPSWPRALEPVAHPAVTFLPEQLQAVIAGNRRARGTQEQGRALNRYGKPHRQGIRSEGASKDVQPSVKVLTCKKSPEQGFKGEPLGERSVKIKNLASVSRLSGREDRRQGTGANLAEKATKWTRTSCPRYRQSASLQSPPARRGRPTKALKSPPPSQPSLV